MLGILKPGLLMASAEQFAPVEEVQLIPRWLEEPKSQPLAVCVFGY